MNVYQIWFGSVRFAEVFTNLLENVHERLIFRTHVGDYNINVKKNCCFIKMCKAHSKVTHIKQQKYFLT